MRCATSDVVSRLSMEPNPHTSDTPSRAAVCKAVLERPEQQSQPCYGRERGPVERYGEPTTQQQAPRPSIPRAGPSYTRLQSAPAAGAAIKAFGRTDMVSASLGTEGCRAHPTARNAVFSRRPTGYSITTNSSAASA